AGRSPGAVSGEVRDGREPQDRQGTRHHRAAVHSAARRRGDRMIRRREFIAGLGSVVSLPVLARAQQGRRVGPIAVLMGTAESAEYQNYLSRFFGRLAELGWKTGVNLSVDVRWWKDGQQMQPIIAEMLASSPDVVVPLTNLALATLKPLARNVPVVF